MPDTQSKVTYVVVLSEAQRAVLLRYNDDIVRSDYDTEEDFKDYNNAMEQVYRAKGMRPSPALGVGRESIS